MLAHRLLVTAVCCTLGTTIARAQPAPATFVNPIAEGADPWVTQHQRHYYYCRAIGDRVIAVQKSTSHVEPGPLQVVWRAPRRGPYSQQVWAPELHRIGERWYIYFAASDGDNRNHLSYVLESKTDDPLGEYQLHGPLYTGDTPDDPATNRWAIDATVLQRPEANYCIWSGWHDDRDEQWLYIARMESPTKLATPRVRIAHNADHLWERVDESPQGRGLAEGAQVLERNGRTFVVYSCSGSWQTSYKLGMLELKPNSDPLDPKSWTKFDQPVFVGNNHTYGVGHASFVKSPDGTEDWIVYHAKRDRRDGWRRAIYTQPFDWTSDGLPQFGQPVRAGVQLPLPSGSAADTANAATFEQSSFQSFDHWRYYGHHQLIKLDGGRVFMGVLPSQPINDFRSGEKLLVDGHTWSDVVVTTELRFEAGERDAGILLRVTQPAVGYDAQRGYFAGLVRGSSRAVIGRTDGHTWHELASAPLDIDFSQPQTLAARAVGNKISLSVDGQTMVSATDDTYATGTVGLRVVDTAASFGHFKAEPIAD